MDSKRIPALDGIRGIAILLVIAFHARIVFTTTAEMPYIVSRVLGLGWSGVDLFFVLSGFLITGILLDTRESPRYFQAFYLRRILRIFPLYFAYLFLILVVVRSFAPVDLWRETNPWWYVTYLLNWKWDHGYNDLFLGHLWSLAVEEQFYLVWPAVIWAIPKKSLRWLCPLVALGALGARWYLGAHGWDSESIYRMTPCRMDGLAIGSWLALGIREFPSQTAKCVRLAFLPAVLLLLASWASSPDPVWSDAPMRTAGATALAGLYGCLVFRSATAKSGILYRICCSRVLRLCGKYSYAMYVLHSAPYHLTVEFVHRMPLVLKYLYFPALAGIALGLSLISWWLLERPFLAWKRRVTYGTPQRAETTASHPISTCDRSMPAGYSLE